MQKNVNISFLLFNYLNKMLFMPFYKRKPLRLKTFDYSTPGYYFVTVCTEGGKSLFGEIVDGQMQLNEWGNIVAKCWNGIPKHFVNTNVDEFIVMPDHFHGIMIVAPRVFDVGATHASPLHLTSIWHRPRPCGPKRRSLGAIVGSFKSAATKRINLIRNTPGVSVWQRNYFERVIRNEKELFEIRQYIQQNPLKWELERFH